MHFDSVALKDLYFIDSQWLCDVFAHVVSPKINGMLRFFAKKQPIMCTLGLLIKY